MIYADAKLTSKAQTTVPKAVREFLGLKPGDAFAYVEIDGRITLVPRNRDIMELAGILGPPPNPGPHTQEDFDRAIGEAVAERFRRAVKPDESSGE